MILPNRVILTSFNNENRASIGLPESVNIKAIVSKGTVERKSIVKLGAVKLQVFIYSLANYFGSLISSCDSRS